MKSHTGVYTVAVIPWSLIWYGVLWLAHIESSPVTTGVSIVLLAIQLTALGVLLLRTVR